MGGVLEPALGDHNHFKPVSLKLHWAVTETCAKAHSSVVSVSGLAFLADLPPLPRRVVEDSVEVLIAR